MFAVVHIISTFIMMEQISDRSELINVISRYPFVMYYQGDYQERPTISISEIVEWNLKPHLKKGAIRRIVYLIIEVVQNIERYSAHIDSGKDYSLIFSDQNSLHLVTQNVVFNDSIDELKQRLDDVNSKNKEELKEAYMDVLSTGEGTEKGAGLGLIDIARKSGSFLDYEFNDYSDDHSVYSLHVTIPLVKDGAISIDRGTELIKILNDSFKENKSSVFYSGDFSNTFLHAILKLLNDSKKSSEIAGNTGFQHALIEITQNVLKHGVKFREMIPGYLCLEWKENCLQASTASVITDKDLNSMSEKLDMLNAASKEELDEISEKALLDFSVEGGLGLITVAQLSRPNLLNYYVTDLKKFGKTIIFTTQFSNQ